MTEGDTITETRTETTTREVTKHRCPLCETYHESDDLAVMNVGGHETDLCRYCAASVLDVEADDIDVYGDDTPTEQMVAHEEPITWRKPVRAMLSLGLFGLGLGTLASEAYTYVTPVGVAELIVSLLAPIFDLLLIVTVLLFMAALIEVSRVMIRP